MSNNFAEGTTHVTYLHKKGQSRDRRKCIYYNKDGSCGNASKCIGSSHCSLYITPEQYEKRKKREEQLKQKSKKRK